MKENIQYSAVSGLRHFAAATFMLGVAAFGALAQSSLPAPGAGGRYNPAPNGIGWNPGPPPPSAWGGYGGWYNSPSVIINSSYPNSVNSGVTNVIACGYDAQGVWRNIPMYVSYVYNGVGYDVTVLNAWNPWTDSWDKGVDDPAYNTSYYINGRSFDFYTVLSTGTYYFNL